MTDKNDDAGEGNALALPALIRELDDIVEGVRLRQRLLVELLQAAPAGTLLAADALLATLAPLDEQLQQAAQIMTLMRRGPAKPEEP